MDTSTITIEPSKAELMGQLYALAEQLGLGISDLRFLTTDPPLPDGPGPTPLPDLVDGLGLRVQLRVQSGTLQYRYLDSQDWTTAGVVGGSGGVLEPVDIPISTVGQTSFALVNEEPRRSLYLNGVLLGSDEYTIAPPTLTYSGFCTLDPDDTLTLKP
ncbi:hypothetical protein [Spirosoma sordidisoli]|uniref:Uncharacterized protein n=1 Tax=Spirosoma sordidisoli TaxID=2502893 RepID=A0A4V1RWA9_9BACT|nr:hypothetical protein [Spirosoma sordidisoli]RYC69628.1 hypothetical protein EQG79_13590 [Spirosoma sordidisoli]